MRIYDHRIVRFLSVDPLNRDFPWYTPYQFSGNVPVRFIDLDGAEPWDPFTKWLIKDVATTFVKSPNSTKSKIYGAVIGIGGSVEGTIKGIIYSASHPIETAKGIWHMANNSPAQNAVEYGLRMHGNYGQLPEAAQTYAIFGHFFTDAATAVTPTKNIKLPTIKFSSELPIGTKVLGWSFSRGRQFLMKKASEFKLTHSVETIINSKEYKDISKLTDQQLIQSVFRPENYRMVTENTQTGKLFDGNTRIYELQRRKLDVEVPYQLYTPDNTMFPTPKEPPQKQ